MFYVNNEQVKGIFLNGRNYNYLAYGFGKIIPEDRSAEQLNLNLAYKYLNQYRIEWGTVKDGYENALVSPRMDKPDSNGVFHSPFTYYYNNNIISTKQVPVLITDGNYALSNALVYNDMNINGAINYFAENTDFQGHNVNVFPEKDNYQSAPLLNYEMLNNCSNFDLSISTRFSKAGYPTLYNCNNFSGNFRYVGNSDIKYPGFRGFLYECKDGVFNINCTNMHGGGSDANVTNYYNFSSIQSCNNIKLNITGSSWQVWPHDHSFSSNCNINTYNVISGFGYMNYCNFNVVLPKDSKPEMDKGFTFLNNAENCNYNLQALDSNLYSFRNKDWNIFLFEDLNNCNINLLLNNSTGIDFSFGNRLNNCNIKFDSINFADYGSKCWIYANNCNIFGNVIKSESMAIDFISHSTGVNLNVNASSTNVLSLLWNSSSINGDVILGNETWIHNSNNLILYLYNGNSFIFSNVGDSKFEFYNVNNIEVYGAYNTNFNMRNAVGNAVLRNLNNVKFIERGANYNVTSLDNCYNSWIYANALSETTIENVYNTRLELKDNNPYFGMWRVNNCKITGFPTSAAYTSNCTFNVSLPVVAFRNSSYLTWNNVWPHATPRGSVGWDIWYGTKAGLRSVDNFSGCYLNSNNGSLLYYGGSETFNNVNNMQTDIKQFYNGTVTANLPIYNMEIKFNVDCSTLNLGIVQGGPPHGFVDSSISANTIYAKNTSEYYVQLSNGARLYCENFCNVPFSVIGYGSNEPVMLINNYGTSNSSCRFFEGGLTRIGRLNFQGGAPLRPDLNNGACVFINNATLDGAFVNNSLLFVGSNVTWTSSTKITIGNGRIVNLANWDSNALSFVERKSLAWNIWDSGPWGSRRLIDYCLDV